MTSVVNVINRRMIVKATKVEGTPNAVVRVSRVGIQGPPGKAALVEGGQIATFVWSPPEAQVSWLIAHNLGKYPSVTVADGTGRVILPDVTYHDNNLVELTFSSPTQGYAYLN